MQERFKYIVSGTAPNSFPTETFFGILKCNSEVTLEIPQMYPFRGEWGKPTGTYISIQDSFPMPHKLDMIWLSISEQCFYSIEHDLPAQEFESIWIEHNRKYATNTFEYIVIGMAPYGNVAIWFYGMGKSVVVEWLKGDKIDVSMRDFLPENPSISLNDYCNSYYHDIRISLPTQYLFDKYMQQFTYRYLLLFEHWNKDKNDWRKYKKEETIPELDYIEEALFDGTYDKLHDGGLMNYHQAGKPKKLAVKWHIKKSEYTVYFWFEDEEIRVIFDRFYGAHPDTKTDFMIRIDSEKNKYELALFRYGLKEPQVINESAYQLIVFRNKFECYRSDNYNQPQGAWIW